MKKKKNKTKQFRFPVEEGEGRKGMALEAFDRGVFQSRHVRTGGRHARKGIRFKKTNKNESFSRGKTAGIAILIAITQAFWGLLAWRKGKGEQRRHGEQLVLQKYPKKRVFVLRNKRDNYAVGKVRGRHAYIRTSFLICQGSVWAGGDLDRWVAFVITAHVRQSFDTLRMLALWAEVEEAQRVRWGRGR